MAIFGVVLKRTLKTEIQNQLKAKRCPSCGMEVDHADWVVCVLARLPRHTATNGKRLSPQERMSHISGAALCQLGPRVPLPDADLGQSLQYGPREDEDGS